MTSRKQMPSETHINKNLPSNGLLFLVMGVTLFLFIVLIFIISAIILFSGSGTLSVSVYISLLISLCTAFFICSKYAFPIRKIVSCISSCFGIIVISFLISGLYYDLSFDGLSYHQDAIIQIKEGWNPYLALTKPASGVHGNIVNAFPKGCWLVSASIYDLMENIEYGKAPNIVLLGSLFFISLYYFLNKNIPISLSIIFSSLVSLNPIAISQIFTFYVDGQLATTFGIFLFLLLLSIDYQKLFILIILAFIIVYLCNLKFTGLLLVLIFYACYVTYSLLIKQGRLGILVIGLALCFSILFGFNPYITNTIKHQHPLYPLNRGSDVNIMDGNANRDFQEKSRGFKFFYSMFSIPSNDYENYPSLALIPFSYSIEKLKFYGQPDLRFNGFGPLFGIVFVLSTLLLLSDFLQSTHKANFVFYCILLLAVFCILIFPESWWARYIGMLWCYPLLIIFFSCSIHHRLKLFPFFILSFLIINNLIVWPMTLQYIIRTQQAYKHHIQVLNSLPKDRIYHVDFGLFPAMKKKLDELGFIYVEKDKPNCKSYHYFWMIKLCDIEDSKYE